MNPRFDLESDHNFLSTLLDLGNQVPEEFFNETQRISELKSWAEFCDDHRWRPYDPPSIEGYPGTPSYFCFEVALPSGRFCIYCYWIEPTGVVCVVGANAMA